MSFRAGVYYSKRRVPYNVRQHYTSYKLSFSVNTKSNAGAYKAAQSVTRRLEDYWLGLRPQDVDIPATHLLKPNHADDDSSLIYIACRGYKI